jgi:LPPG:FO 2-phospho-L-lactate transferase
MSVAILAGGTGGAKLAGGLDAVVPAGDLAVIVNTGDDTERHGLLVMPDHDAILYLLAGTFDEARGWGVANESWAVMDALAAYGEDTWFRLGDRDFATHIARHARLAAGASLTDAVRSLQIARGLATAIRPMTDMPIRTTVRTDDGWLDFQDYFVRLHQAPEVREVAFAGIGAAAPTAEVLDALRRASSIVIGPSNPIVSIGPILAVPGMREAIEAARGRGVPVIAVSPIVAGAALKGPADRMLRSLGHEASALGVARIYRGLATDLVIDRLDAGLADAIADLGLRPHVMDTIMGDAAGRARLARDIVALEAGGA